MGKEISDHPICAECDGACCKNWEWFCMNLGPKWRACLKKAGPEKYMTAEWWQEVWFDKGDKPPPLKCLSVVRVTPGLRRVFWRGECLSFDTETNQCGIYEDRPESCRQFPGRRNIKNQQGQGCMLIDVLAAKPAPENYEEYLC